MRVANVTRATSPHTQAGSAWDAKVTAYNMQLKHETSLCRRRRHTHIRATASTSDALTCFIRIHIVYQIPHANSIIDCCIVCGMHTITISYIRELSRVHSRPPCSYNVSVANIFSETTHSRPQIEVQMLSSCSRQGESTHFGTVGSFPHSHAA